MEDTANNDIMNLMNDFYDVSTQHSDNVNKNDVHIKNKEGISQLLDTKVTAIDSNEACVNKKCASNKFILEECNYICTECGTLQDRFIDQTAEWRFYGNNDTKSSDPTRCGMATNDLFPEFSLGSVIAYEYGKNSSDMRNLCKYQRWNSTSYKERSLYNTVEHIYSQATSNGIPQTIIDEAKVMYKSLSEQQISRGDNRSGIIASCLYWSCKKNSVPRSAKEISRIFNINITTMTRGCKIFHNLMKINVESTNAQDFILRFCSNLNLGQDTIDICLHIVDITENYGIVSENSPTSIACGIIYLVCTVCDLDITKKDISEKCQVSEVTINKCFKKLNTYKNVLLPKDIIERYSVK